MPKALRLKLADGAVTRVAGSLPEHFNRLVLIVSHELAAAGAPKALAEVVIACRNQDWAVIVVGPADGPYTDILVKHGALVVVSDHALDALSPAVTLSKFADVIVCNTIACAHVVARLPAKKVAWYLHETGAIDTYLEHFSWISQSIRQVCDVWAASNLVSDKIFQIRPYTFILEAGCEVLDIPLPPNTDTVKSLVLGSLELRKGQDLPVDAYRQLSPNDRSNLRVDLYGRILDIDFASKLKLAIDNTPGLSYCGVLAPSAAINALRDAHMVIICSRDEPLSLVAVEAMSAQRIVVCSTAVGIAAYLQDGVNAYIAPSCKPHDLAETIARALRDRPNWQTIGRAGNDVYYRYFSSDVFQRKVIERLKFIMEGDIKQIVRASRGA